MVFRAFTRSCLIIALTFPTTLLALDLIEWQLVKTLDHDQSTFTQGLLYDNEGDLIESSGQYRASYLRELNGETMAVKRTSFLRHNMFAEGVTLHQNELYLLTWKENWCLIYDPVTFEETRRIPIEGEGWGITSDGETLWMTNGSDQLITLDPETGTALDIVKVTLDGHPLNYLNELEFINGYVYANRWFDTKVYIFDPEDGVVIAALDLQQLAQPHISESSAKVLNGIAWNDETQQLAATGKYWPVLHILSFTPPVK